MPPRSTVWPLEDHTIGKHLVLKSYMDAWLPIVLKTYNRALFADVFAGPGEYSGGESGSPIIALNALAEHAHHDVMTGHMDYVFVEEDVRRFKHLDRLVDGRRDSLPAFCSISTFNKTYHTAFPKLIELLEAESSVPAFVMIDPFGVSGVFMDQVEQLMTYPSTEVYISFMYREINRFASQPEFTEHLDRLFGSPDWRLALDIEDPTARRMSFHETYERQLRKSGAGHVLPFELFDGNRHVYTLFFATQNSQGCDKMKQAMWKVAPFGDFRFSGGMDRQFILGPDIVDYAPLKADLLSTFVMDNFIQIESVERYMRSDRTLFHTGQFKKVLADLEHEGRIQVKEGTRKRRSSFPPGTVFKFAEPTPAPTKPYQTSFSL